MIKTPDLLANLTPDILIDTARQKLILHHEGAVYFEVDIGSGINGVGELNGTEKTPRGWHDIVACIGEGCAVNTVFRGRRSTGEIYSTDLSQQYPERDWVLSRILWLRGLEVGRNRLGNVDTQRRYIYLHGCPDEVTLGMPSSHGCIRMRNADIIRLFDRVKPGATVLIK